MRARMATSKPRVKEQVCRGRRADLQRWMRTMIMREKIFMTKVAT